MKLFVGGINPSVTSEQLTELFSTYGRVLKATIVKSRKNQYSKCFGFVVMPSYECAKLAQERLNDYELEGSHIKIRESYKKVEPEPKYFVFQGYR